MSRFRYVSLATLALLALGQAERGVVACDCEKKATVKKVANTRSLNRGVLREWRGSQSGVAEAGQKVVRSQAEWDALWSRVSAGQVPPPPAPKVDWKNEMVVALFMGERPTGGFNLAIKSVTPSEKEVVVAYEETAPAPDAITIQVITAPYAMAVVKRSSLPVRFTRVGAATVQPPGL